MSFIEVNQNPIFFTIARKMVNTCVTHMMFDGNNILTNKFVFNLYVLLPSRN